MESEFEFQLTPLQHSDAPEMLLLLSDKEAVRMTNWPHLSTLEESRSKVGHIRARYEGNPYHFGPYIIRQATGTFIGIMGADVKDEAAGVYIIWYDLHRKNWGRGFATRAVQKLLKMMRESGRVKRIEATAVVENLASWKLLERHGFLRTGILSKGHTRHGENLDLYEYALHW